MTIIMNFDEDICTAHSKDLSEAQDYGMSALSNLKCHLRPGQVYRRKDLAR